jgi:hypothetical protein
MDGSKGHVEVSNLLQQKESQDAIKQEEASTTTGFEGIVRSVSWDSKGSITLGVKVNPPFPDMFPKLDGEGTVTSKIYLSVPKSKGSPRMAMLRGPKEDISHASLEDFSLTHPVHSSFGAQEVAQEDYGSPSYG